MVFNVYHSKHGLAVTTVFEGMPMWVLCGALAMAAVLIALTCWRAVGALKPPVWELEDGDL